ncbi:MAG: type II toxin-antitoxin system VapC family toxin [Acidimicrobiia bacterium]
MNVVDANVLIYAVNDDSDRHDEAKAWLDRSLSGAAIVGFSWIALLAFVRLTTKANLFQRPLSVDEALDCVDAWMASPAAVVVEPTSQHLALVRSLLVEAGIAGNLVSDVHLAALAIEHRGRVISYDSDFARFPGVRWAPPSAN